MNTQLEDAFSRASVYHARGRATRSIFDTKALQDLWQGWRYHRELWLAIAFYDIRKRYRRSVLGPFWITISLGSFVVVLSFLYVPLMGNNVDRYLPFVALGFVGWQLILELVLQGSNVFIANAPIIQQLQSPLSVYIYETVCKN